MARGELLSQVRRYRQRAGLSQQALAHTVGATRQAVLAIEAGRQVPSTRMSLRLAQALACKVEDLFQLPGPAGIVATLAPGPPALGPSSHRVSHHRVMLGNVRGRWVAHRLNADSLCPADGMIASVDADLTQLEVQPLGELQHLEGCALIAGCAPLLGVLAARAGHRSLGSGVSWVQATSERSLDLLERGLVHVAGVHLFDAKDPQANLQAVRRRFAKQRMTLVNLTCWQQGLVLPPNNPLGISGVHDLNRSGIRLARRADGAGATKLLRCLLHDPLLDGPLPSGPFARGHVEVAQLVRMGAADVGVAIEAVALAAGLRFLPLAQERFDLVLPADLRDQPGVLRLLEALNARPFRTEAGLIPGYDQTLAGQTTTVQAA
jgi:molybdate-binding protein/DNA-binding XRE family transcriptional regulator